eukprot:scaffold393622_cov39-Attheya_sp.AAC.1
MSPLPSARKDIGLMITRQLALQISIGATRAATKCISHDPPTRTRPRKARATIGGLPLSRDRTSYIVPMDIDSDTTTTFNYENSATTAQSPLSSLARALCQLTCSIIWKES